MIPLRAVNGKAQQVIAEISQLRLPGVLRSALETFSRERKASANTLLTSTCVRSSRFPFGICLTSKSRGCRKLKNGEHSRSYICT